MLTIQDSTVYFGSASPESGSGAHKETALLSITSAPAAPFAKGSKFFRDEENVPPELNKKIYTAVADGTWDGAKISEPVFGAYYTYNGDTYTWDGDSLQIFELEDYQLIKDKTDSPTAQGSETYPSSQALYDGLSFKEDLSNKAQNFEDITSTTKYPTVKAVADYVVKESIIRNFDDAGITKTTSSYTFPELADEIRKKQFTTGTTLYGEVRNQGMPTGIGNAEIRVEILETKNIVNPTGSSYKSQVLEFTLFSTDVEPKEWTFIYYDQRNTPWAWVPKDHIVIVSAITMFQIPNAPLGSELPLPVLDDITTPGEYTIRFDLSAMEPGALLIGNLVVSNAGLISQKYTCEISGATFVLTRQKENNTWTPWFCISGLNNFFTPANLVAGTNLQITHAADESGYDKYTVGTTDKVWTQDNLIAGNNTTFTPVVDPYSITSDTLVCLPFDGNTTDLSNYAADTTVRYDGTYTNFNADGKFNQCGYIAGYHGFIYIKNSNIFNNDELMIDFWSKCSLEHGLFYFDLIKIEGNSTTTYYNRFSFNMPGTLDLGYNRNNFDTTNISSLGTTWHHYAISIKKNNYIKVFIDGHIVKTYTDDSSGYISNFTEANAIALGVGSYTYFDEFRISKKCLWETDFTAPTLAYTRSTTSAYQINAPIMTGATSLANGVAGVVPAPAIADKDKFLKGDGTWSTTVPTLTWYTNNTTASITIADTSTARLVKVYLNGMLLQPTQDYTISGTTLTFPEALVAKDKVTIEVI